MKFDFIIGNPPYQEETVGTSDTPIYNIFMDAAYSMSDKVILITPARFLFNAGKTPKDWNEKMLHDKHLSVIDYQPNSSYFFPNTDIKGGVAITYHDKTQDFGPIGFFSRYPELTKIVEKVVSKESFSSLSTIIYLQNKFDLDVLYADYPEYKDIIGSGGTEKRLTTKILEQLSVFTSEKECASEIEIQGVIKNRRVSRFIDAKYILPSENLNNYKILIPKSSGAGLLGEVLSTPIIVGPSVGYTQTYIGIGSFETSKIAKAALKYIKSKFARLLLGVSKVTQDNNRETWTMIPMQDFTASSEIDWSKSIKEIDQQLYAKYGFDEEDITFTESHVKEME